MQITELTGGRGPFVAGTFFDLGTVGYEQAEYAMAVTAQAFDRTDAGLDVVEEADVVTRLLVYRPQDAAAFNGTVVVEWLNVTGGLDAAPVWLYVHRELLRRGAAWIGLSAQRVGVHGGGGLLGLAGGMALLETDPERYSVLDLPADRFSYDLLTHAAAVARGGYGTILDDLDVDLVLAAGESQSAFRLTTYVNDLDARTAAFDGYLVHARGGSAAALVDGGEVATALEGPAAPFASELRVPVMCVEAETDLINLNYHVARQDDHEQLVVWELAGCSHADVYTFGVGWTDDGRQPIEDLARSWRPSRELFGMTLDELVNAGPQHYLMQAAMHALESWARDGDRPPASPRLELDGTTGFLTDDDGIALGGIRTPHVDVPVARLSGLGNGGAPMAILTGSTVPFAKEDLVARYGTTAGYVDRFRASAEEVADAGFLLHDDLDEMVAIAAANVEL